MYISLLILVDLDKLSKPIGLCGSCLLGSGVSGWRRRGWGEGSSKLSSDAVSFSMSDEFPASSIDDGARFVIQLSCGKLDPLCILRDECFACLTRVVSGTGRWSMCQWWCWCGGCCLPLLLSAWRWPIFVHRSQGVLVEHMHWMLRPFQGLEPPMKMDSDESRTEMEDGFGRV
jgi:hypothetical protein